MELVVESKEHFLQPDGHAESESETTVMGTGNAETLAWKIVGQYVPRTCN